MEDEMETEDNTVINLNPSFSFKERFYKIYNMIVEMFPFDYQLSVEKKLFSQK